jgi:GrpB-like predicted nucleotidyltransferase (UPF0157 family)
MSCMTLEERVRRVVQEDVAVVNYDPRWPALFEQKRDHLRSCLPGNLLRRIEHFGSTAVPRLPAKPIVDMLVEITDLEAAELEIAPVLESQGYDYFWRPTFGDDTPPYYAWFINRDRARTRTQHIHMIEVAPTFREHWERLCFRDYLIAHSDIARLYAELKIQLASVHPNDRVAYTAGKSEFIAKIMARIRQSPAL